MVRVGGGGVLQLQLQRQAEQGPDVEVGGRDQIFLSYHISDRRNPLCAVFPTEVSCNIPNVGAAGNEQAHNGLCVLTQVNIDYNPDKTTLNVLILLEHHQ